MHVWTRLKKESQGRTGIGLYPDGMVEHDDHVGLLLKKLDDLGIADNTIVVYSTDNGAENGQLAGRRHHAVPRREGHDLGGWLPRALQVVRWPGVIKPGTIINDIMSHEDWLPTFLHAAGVPGIVEKAQEGATGQRQGLEGPPRRLRLPALLQG